MLTMAKLMWAVQISDVKVKPKESTRQVKNQDKTRPFIIPKASRVDRKHIRFCCHLLVGILLNTARIE